MDLPDEDMRQTYLLLIRSDDDEPFISVLHHAVYSFSHSQIHRPELQFHNLC